MNKILDKIPIISYDGKLLFILDKKIENITEKFDHVTLAVKNNQIVLLGPPVKETLTNKPAPEKMEVVSTVY